jgi:hypothetical protein
LVGSEHGGWLVVSTVVGPFGTKEFAQLLYKSNTALTVSFVTLIEMATQWALLLTFRRSGAMLPSTVSIKVR